MAIRIVNKVGIADTEAELLVSISSNDTSVYCIDTNNTYTRISDIWVIKNNNSVTDAEKIKLSNLSGTNSGDNANNTQYSGLATSKQDTLVSATNIKTINGNSILGSGNLVISGGGGSSNGFFPMGWS